MMNKMMSVAAFAAALTLTASCALAGNRRREDRRPEYRKDHRAVCRHAAPV